MTAWKEPIARPNCSHAAHVFDGAFQRAVGGAHGLDGEHGGGGVPDGGQRGGHVGLFVAQQLGFDIAQFEPGLRPCPVQGRLPRAHEPLGTGPHQEQQRPRPREPSGVRGHHQQPGAVPVEHLRRLPVEPPHAVRPARLHTPGATAVGPVATVVTDQPEGGGQARARYREGGGERTRGQPRQQGEALVLGTEGQDQRGGENSGGQQRRGGEGAARLLAGEGEFGHRAADTAVCLGEGESGQPELPREGFPERRVIAAWGPLGGPQLLRAAPFDQQLPQRAAYLLLLRGEMDIHGRAPPSSGSGTAGRRTSQI